MISIVTPTLPDTATGNGVTAARWASILSELGHTVRIDDHFRTSTPGPDVLIALHARKSEAAVRTFRALYPQRPLVVALTGTDVYPNLSSTGVDPGVLAAADRLIVLQRAAMANLPPALRDKTRVVEQSATAEPAEAATGGFQVAFLSHLRAVKDPLLLAQATTLLPAESAIHVVHLGSAHEQAMRHYAQVTYSSNPRYDWRGPVDHAAALRILAGSRLLVLTSQHEGGANVISEALAAGVPIVSSRIPGSVGLLGPDYAGYFRPGDAADLARVLRCAETDDNFYRLLIRQCAARRQLADPRREHNAWRALLDELVIPITTY